MLGKIDNVVIIQNNIKRHKTSLQYRYNIEINIISLHTNINIVIIKNTIKTYKTT